jgi:hypothetical protein
MKIHNQSWKDNLGKLPKWFRDCKNNGHEVDIDLEGDTFECATCNKSESINDYLQGLQWDARGPGWDGRY